MSTPAAWHPDPLGRHHYRYWDGTAWTEHVSTNGVQSSDPMTSKPGITDRIDQGLSFGAPTAESIQKQVHGDGSPSSYRTANVGGQIAFGGDGTLFNEPVLVVNQKAKLIEITNQYAVFDQAGKQIGAVNEVGQSKARKALRLISNVDQFLTHRYEISDQRGAVVLRLTRPAKVFKSTVIVSDGNDAEIGRIVQDNVFGKIHFTLQVGDTKIGSINAENWRAWNFRIEDHGGNEVARVTKTFEGFAKAMFTTADNYVVQIHRQLTAPLNAMVVAAALTIDTALKQDDR